MFTFNQRMPRGFSLIVEGARMSEDKSISTGYTAAEREAILDTIEKRLNAGVCVICAGRKTIRFRGDEPRPCPACQRKAN